MPNIPDAIRMQAFQYAAENNVTELTKLIESYPDLVSVRSKWDNSSLLVRACEFLSKDVIELLIPKGVDPEATNSRGNNGIMYLFYRHAPHIKDKDTHDIKALEILELLKEKKMSLNCFVAQDVDKDTPLIEAGRAELLKCSKFIVELLKEQDLLQAQLSHKNNSGNSFAHFITSQRSLDYVLGKTKEPCLPFETAQHLVDDAIKCSSPTAQEKDTLLSLVKDILPKLNTKELTNVASMAFQERLYNDRIGSDSTFHKGALREERACGNFGVKIFNSIDVALIELLYVAGGINLSKYKDFITSLPHLQDTNLNNKGMCSAVILESNKHKILQVIKGSNTLSTYVSNPSELYFNVKDMATTADLALKRFCFLAANNNNLEINKNSEAELLLTFANITKHLDHYPIDDKFKEFLIVECQNYGNFQEVLKTHGSKIEEVVRSEGKFIPKLLGLGKSFEGTVSVLSNKIVKLLDLSTGDLLSKKISPGDIDDKKEGIKSNDTALLAGHSKFFSDTYYQNNPEVLMSSLVLLRIANEGTGLLKLRAILDNHYTKAKATVVHCLNVFSKHYECYNSLKQVNLNPDIIKQNLLSILPELDGKIKAALNNHEVKENKDITTLCKEVQPFLDIGPITALFEKHDQSNQTIYPPQEAEQVSSILGDMNIEWG